jgi:hypothetical protein
MVMANYKHFLEKRGSQLPFLALQKSTKTRYFRGKHPSMPPSSSSRTVTVS